MLYDVDVPLDVYCDSCGIKFLKIPALIRRSKRNFCSCPCAWRGATKKVAKICEECSGEYLVSPAVSMFVGRRRSKFCSLDCRYKNMEKRNRGPASIFWRGGVSLKNRTARSLDMASAKYKRWRKKVFERDDYTCQECGIRNGGGTSVKLRADHIKPYALYPKERYEIKNGRTLCSDCDIKTETFGGRIRKFYKEKGLVYHKNRTDRVCSVRECGKKYLALGFCKNHYESSRRKMIEKSSPRPNKREDNLYRRELAARRSEKL